MKMNKLIRLIVLAFALSMPISIWGNAPPSIKRERHT